METIPGLVNGENYDLGVKRIENTENTEFKTSHTLLTSIEFCFV